MIIFQTPKLSSRARNQRGAGLIEYALLIAMVSLIAAAAIPSVGNGVAMSFDNAKKQFPGAGYNPVTCEPGSPIWPGCAE